MNEVIGEGPAPSQLLSAPPSQSMVMSTKNRIHKYATFPPQAAYLLSVFGHVSTGWLIG